MEAESDKITQVLQRTEDRYRLLAEHVSDVIFTLDLNLRFTYCSPSMERLTGYTVEEVMIQTLEHVLTPASFQTAKKTLEEELARKRAKPRASPEPQTLELELTRKGGGTVWAEVKTSFLRAQRGEVVGVLGVARDITERRRAKDHLEKERQTFLSVLEQAPYGIVLVDRDGRCLYANGAFTQITGYTLDDIPTGRVWFQKAFRDETYRKEVVSAWKKDLAAGEVTRAFRVLCKDQIPKEVEFKSAALEDGGTVTMLSDITARKSAEEALLTSQLHLSVAMDLTRIVYWERDEAAGELIFNDAFYAFYGTTAEQEGGYRMAAEEYSKRFIHPDDRAMVRQSAQNSRSGKEPEFLVDIEHRIIRRDGEVRHILARMRGFRDVEGRITRCYGANQDITERKQAEEEKAALESQLLQAQKMEAIGTLSAGIAHDFKNILTAIEGFANLGIKYVRGGNRAKRYLDRICRAVERGKDIVGQILTFSYRSEDEPKPTELIPVIKESVRMLRASLRPTVEIRENFTTESSTVLADPTQAQQIIMNLATNAAHAMGQRGGTLTIELSDFSLTPQSAPAPGMTAGPYLKLSVSDTGTGMDRQTVERVFDPFFTTKKRTEGTGLGLWVVHSIVEKHRGAITVRSAPGEGSTFEVFLPRLID